MLYILCNIISSQDATVCTQCCCLLLNAQKVNLIQKSEQECWSLQRTEGKIQLDKMK